MKWECRLVHVFIVLSALVCRSLWAVEITSPLCENKTNPIGVKTPSPRFGWTFSSDDEKYQQNGYRICAATSIEKLKYPDLWDTGPTSSSQSSDIKYSGETLRSGQRVYWCVHIWYGQFGERINSEPAYFEMGTLAEGNVTACSVEPAADSRSGVTEVTIDGDDPGRTFEGIGAVSAGASTDLLYDYEEPYRSNILDFLFKPGFGASFQHLKVEMGGGENSTCGSEPSHAIVRSVVTKPVSRGYEFWFMKEARNRNPKIVLDYLPWSFPYWLSGKFTQDSADYFVAFLDVAKKQWDLDIDWVAAAENENGTNRDWIVKQLRPALDAKGYSHVKIQGPDDNSGDWKIFDEFENDPVYDNIVKAVGYHYVSGREFNENMVDGRGRPPTEKAKMSGKSLWASEDWSYTGEEWGGAGALTLARLYNKFYIRDRITKTQIWAPIGSIYRGVLWDKAGAMRARSPWSGYYEVFPTIWTTAHTTQFTEPERWRYLDGACGLFDPSTYKGSFVTLRDKESDNWSMVICTETAERLNVTIANGLSSKIVYVWKSDCENQFNKQESIRPSAGSFSIALDGRSVYTLTTTIGQQKGTHPIPEDRPFPFPYKEDYETCRVGDLPKYHSDQKGSFEVALKPDGTKCLKQIVPQEGYRWMAIYRSHYGKPHTLIGDHRWQNYAISADVFIEGGDVEIGGRVHGKIQKAHRLMVNQQGQWALLVNNQILANGVVKDFDGKIWHHLELRFVDDKMEALIDRSRIAIANSKGTGRGLLASSYDLNLFDNLQIAPIESLPRGR